MKRIITSALMLALTIGAAQAQSTEKSSGQAKEQHRGGGGNHHGMDQLDLTAEQKTQLKQLHEKQRTEMEALRNNKSLSADAAKTQRESLHAKQRSELNSILTPRTA
jgi:Spy/CpxP family protein refolding chaperone